MVVVDEGIGAGVGLVIGADVALVVGVGVALVIGIVGVVVRWSASGWRFRYGIG